MSSLESIFKLVSISCVRQEQLRNSMGIEGYILKGSSCPQLPPLLNPENQDEEDNRLPELSVGESLSLLDGPDQGVIPKQHFTQPPPRYNEALLIRELEEKGIGRPSTYATIISTIQDRQYVEKEELRFRPTELGRIVNDQLVQPFSLMSSTWNLQPAWKRNSTILKTETKIGLPR